MSPRVDDEYVEIDGKYYQLTYDGDEPVLDRVHPDEFAEWRDLRRQRLSLLQPNSVDVMLLPTFLQHKPDVPPFIVKPFLTVGGLALLHGLPGCGKSLLATTLAQAVAAGKPFLGRFPVERKHRVTFIQVDMSKILFHERFLRHRFTLENIQVVMAPAQQVERLKDDEPWVNQVRGFSPDLIIVDTLRKIHNLDEDKSHTPGRVYNACRRLFGSKPTFLFLHHDRKPFPGQEDSPRGSGAWTADVDVAMQIRRKELRFTKCRVCEEPKSLWLHIDPETLLVRGTASPDDAAEAYLRQHPRASRGELIRHLVDGGICGRTKAYRVADQYLPNEPKS